MPIPVQTCRKMLAATFLGYVKKCLTPSLYRHEWS